ncbi:MAG TPA: flavodoxin domain-containing protein, partial [Gemmatimonadales bacterium]|nr:flavodoxin domain-containing protein [Gemmatimonadales bacterium]
MAVFLIVHASKYGSTERIAARLEAVLSAAGHRVVRHDVDALPADFSLEPFERLVVAAPVFFGKHPKAI